MSECLFICVCFWQEKKEKQYQKIKVKSLHNSFNDKQSLMSKRNFYVLKLEDES
jgi:hypothetical protein